MLFKIGFIESASHNLYLFAFHISPRGHVTYLHLSSTYCIQEV